MNNYSSCTVSECRCYIHYLIGWLLWRYSSSFPNMSSDSLLLRLDRIIETELKSLPTDALDGKTFCIWWMLPLLWKISTTCLDCDLSHSGMQGTGYLLIHLNVNAAELKTCRGLPPLKTTDQNQMLHLLPLTLDCRLFLSSVCIELCQLSHQPKITSTLGDKQLLRWNQCARNNDQIWYANHPVWHSLEAWQLMWALCEHWSSATW